MITSALAQLCDARWLTGNACNPNRQAITYEVTDMGRGWFRFHHHHFHISLSNRAAAGLNGLHYGVDSLCLTPNCADVPSFKDNPHRHHHGAPEVEPMRMIELPR
jgi:hypothetical protein